MLFRSNLIFFWFLSVLLVKPAFSNQLLSHNVIYTLNIEQINKSLVSEDSLIKANISDIGNLDIKLKKDNINPLKINYFMTCPISRASETMAKCSIAKNSRAAK